MTAGPAVAALALALAAAAPSGTADFRAEIVAQVIRPCLVRLARRYPTGEVSPEALADALIARNPKALERLVDRIEWQIAHDLPAPARRQIYRVALRFCLRQGAASLSR